VLPGDGDSSHVAAVDGSNHPDAGSSSKISSVDLDVLHCDGILIICFLSFRMSGLYVHAVWINFEYNVCIFTFHPYLLETPLWQKEL
jgi:hypothetical protein